MSLDCRFPFVIAPPLFPLSFAIAPVLVGKLDFPFAGPLTFRPPSTIFVVWAPSAPTRATTSSGPKMLNLKDLKPGTKIRATKPWADCWTTGQVFEILDSSHPAIICHYEGNTLHILTPDNAHYFELLP